MEEMFGCSAMSDVVCEVMTSGWWMMDEILSQTEQVVRCYKANITPGMTLSAINWGGLSIVKKSNGM